MPIYLLVLHGEVIIQLVSIFIKLDDYGRNPKNLLQLLFRIAFE